MVTSALSVNPPFLSFSPVSTPLLSWYQLKPCSPFQLFSVLLSSQPPLPHTAMQLNFYPPETWPLIAQQILIVKPDLTASMSVTRNALMETQIVNAQSHALLLKTVRQVFVPSQVCFPLLIVIFVPFQAGCSSLERMNVEASVSLVLPTAIVILKKVSSVSLEQLRLYALRVNHVAAIIGAVHKRPVMDDVGRWKMALPFAGRAWRRMSPPSERM